MMYLYFRGCVGMMLWRFIQDALWNSMLYLYIVDEYPLYRFTWFFNRGLAWTRAFFSFLKYGLESRYWKGSVELKDETICMASRCWITYSLPFQVTFYCLGSFPPLRVNRRPHTWQCLGLALQTLTRLSVPESSLRGQTHWPFLSLMT